MRNIVLQTLRISFRIFIEPKDSHIHVLVCENWKAIGRKRLKWF